MAEAAASFVPPLAALSPSARAFLPPSRDESRAMRSTASNGSSNINNKSKSNNRSKGGSNSNNNAENGAAASLMIPSQAINARNKARSNSRNRRKKQGGRAGRGHNNNSNSNTNSNSNSNSSGQTNNTNNIHESTTTRGNSSAPSNNTAVKSSLNNNARNTDDEGNENVDNDRKKAKRNNNNAKNTRTKRNNKPNQNNDTDTHSTNQNHTNNKPQLPATTKKKKKKRNKNKRLFPWRKHIPPGTVDPISLDPLHMLTYPPFALKITPPYSAIPEWPIPAPPTHDHTLSNDQQHPNPPQNKLQLDKSIREKKILEEQWGSFAISPNHTHTHTNKTILSDTAPPKTSTSTAEDTVEHYHLFDGRVLAYYLVSQLQFIDPLNRRDLTRDEVLHLDAYLVRHKLNDKRNNNADGIRVLEAYDARGGAASMAGVSGQTERGRADILQQEARVLLNAIFQANLVGNGSRVNNNNNNNNDQGEHHHQQQQQQQQRDRNRGGNDLARQYAESQAHQSTTLNNDRRHTNTTVPRRRPNGAEEDVGIYVHEGGGMLIIDDDANPGLRGGENSLTMQDYDPSLAYNHGGQTDDGNDSTTRSNPLWTARNRTTDTHATGDRQEEDVPSPGSGGPALGDEESNGNSLWTSRNILTRHCHAARVRADNFPTLSATAAPTVTATESRGQTSSSTQNLNQTAGGSTASNHATPGNRGGGRGMSNSLIKIGNMVQKLSAKQLEKQRKARETALHQAKLQASGGFNLPFEGFGSDGSTQHGVTEGQAKRNDNVASALGLEFGNGPRRLNSGWARPTSQDTSEGNNNSSNNRVIYPDALIIRARELMPQVLKLERKWTTFLEDDTAASCPLKAMDRPARKFTHEYSDYWNLHTESFDPEPKRYVHCVKLLETQSPSPLLSQAVRTWRGPTTQMTTVNHIEGPSDNRSITATATSMGASDAAAQQTAGQVTMSTAPPVPRGALHLPEGRIPLKLEPRTLPHGVVAPPGAMFDIVVDPVVVDDEGGGAAVEDVETQPMLSINASKGPSLVPQEPAPRFAPLLAERDERTRLVLEPRTKPLELPPFQPIRMTDLKATIHANRKAIEEKTSRQVEKKKSILATAFASDDEEDSASGSGSDEESDWEVGEAMYTGGSSDEDE